MGQTRECIELAQAADRAERRPTTTTPSRSRPHHTTPLLVLVIPSTPAPSCHSCQARGVPTAVPFPMLCILHAEMMQWLGSSSEYSYWGACRTRDLLRLFCLASINSINSSLMMELKQAHSTACTPAQSTGAGGWVGYLYDVTAVEPWPWRGSGTDMMIHDHDRAMQARRTWSHACIYGMAGPTSINLDACMQCMLINQYTYDSYMAWGVP